MKAELNPNLDKPELKRDFATNVTNFTNFFPFSCQFVTFVAGYSCSMYKNFLLKYQKPC